ncbi:MAG: cupin domain-containing protein [Ruminococcaceae bacterium]|nr:cupin domain-containing protein [Oscillospiraceae bacterium]
MREILDITPEQMAVETGLTTERYLACEAGEVDLSISFIHKCALRFGVDVSDIIEGKSPNLRTLSVVRAGNGTLVDRRSEFDYTSLAPLFRDKIAEPFLVRAAYSEEEQRNPIKLSTHAGQEIDIVVKGALKLVVGGITEILRPGDTALYNSSEPHGMIATGGDDCEFYAIVVKGDERSVFDHSIKPAAVAPIAPVAEKFIETKTDENGIFNGIGFKNIDNFNFAYDVVDEIAKKKPEKLALLHISSDKKERRFTFDDISRESNRTANYFRSLGIGKGDRVLLVLKRHYQFWFSMMALNKLGAIAIPATNQLVEHDFEYRFNAAGVSAVVATADGDVAHQIELALEKSPTVKTKIIVNGSREGWHDFDAELPMFRSKLERVPVGGDDPLLMYFTSGTTGYPKIAVHSHKYPLGHYPTAHFWHNVDPNGLHLTISDTGWAKAMWGKLYGQWFCEGGLFVYDFDRFHADDILPMFAKYGITTFCAPPTMYRFFIKEDLSKYDLSSIKYSTIAGEALNPEVYEQWKRATGLALMEAFGQTESTVIVGNFVGMTPKPGSMGKPSPLYDVHLIDGDGNEVADGDTGEICIKTELGKTPGLFIGYYNDKEHTDEAWYGGYYHTGDTAWRDEDGYFHYVGRTDDLIKSSGYRIGPFEIESVIMELPYVLECAVTAAPDPVRGQVVKASVVLVKGKEGTDALKKEIQEYVKSHTAPYKYPRIVEFLDEMPKTVSGKIRRSELRKQSNK